MKDLLAKLGGRNFTISGAALGILATMNGLDVTTKAWCIAVVAGAHAISRGLADGLSKGTTASK